MKSLQQQLQEAYLGMKGVLSEEDEQVVSEILALDELSKETLGRYVSRAVDDVASKAQKSGSEKVGGMPNMRHVKAAAKRIRGVNKAVERLTKEDVEQAIEELVQEALEDLDESVLNELSKKTLGSYINKASSRSAEDARDIGNITGLKTRAKEAAKVQKRLKNITKATSRLTREQKELISDILDELIEESEDELYESMDGVSGAEGTKVKVHNKNVKHHGKKGEIIQSGRGGAFHVVKFKDGSSSSFQGSDLKRIDD